MASPNPGALAALARLRDGNHRFASGLRSIDSLASAARRDDFVSGQKPFAVIIGCSDSRAPAEIVFDQGLGDLFVIRVAGNVVAPSGVGSVEFAAERFGIRLCVVMGHTRCGAIDAALDADPSVTSRNVMSIVGRVRPHIEGISAAMPGAPRDVLVRAASKANVRAQVAQVRQGSAFLEKLILEEGMLVVGALYELETGRVDFFEGVPER
jgi:carbonic anhydrase